MSMMASVAGFAAPGLVATYVLRTPEEVDASQDEREFTEWALFAPGLSLLTLLGFLYSKVDYKRQEEKERETIAGMQIDERIALLDPDFKDRFMFHPRTEANRRHSTMIMHIPQLSFEHEHLAARAQRHSTTF